MTPSRSTAQKHRRAPGEAGTRWVAALAALYVLAMSLLTLFEMKHRPDAGSSTVASVDDAGRRSPPASWAGAISTGMEITVISSPRSVHTGTASGIIHYDGVWPTPEHQVKAIKARRAVPDSLLPPHSCEPRDFLHKR